MGTAPISETVLANTKKVYLANDRNIRKTAQELGIARSTLQNRLDKIDVGTEDLIFPDLPSSELDPKELIAQAAVRFERHLVAREARRWMEIKIKTNKPIGLAFVGDPHVDDPGCNWPLLNRDISILANTPGLFATNMGDLTNNWVGRLIRLYADQEMSKKQAWKLAKYFMRDAGINWLCHIIGNHDAWNDGPYLIKANAAPEVPVEDYQARFQLVFPNEQTVRIHAAHDFPGHSQWNELHSAKKKSMMGEQADIYACADKHNWQIQEGENADRGFVYWLIRSRGYKFIDHYADQLGFASQKNGATVTAIINPTVEGPRRIRCFPELEEAAEFLTYLRARS